MFCRESTSLQTLNIAKSLSSLFPQPSAFIKPISAGRRPNLGRRCKVTASSRSNIDPKGKTVTKTVKKIKVKGFISAQEGLLDGISFTRGLDDIADLVGRSLLVELISSDEKQKDPVADYAQRVWFESPDEKYECEFDMPEDFGPVEAIRVQNQHHREMFFKEVELELPGGTVKFTCNSWVAPKSIDPAKRIFFSNKSYLPGETPEPLKKLRKEELETLQGKNRKRVGEFARYERVYDYDVYNDVGDPDKDEKLARPVIGGLSHPYPRRCKTGRQASDSDPSTEKRIGEFYVPRDEEFSIIKGTAFTGKAVLAALPSVFPQIESVLLDPSLPFPHFKSIEDLFEVGIQLPKDTGLLPLIPSLVRAVSEARDDILQFHSPVLLKQDRWSWIRDDEFARQTLAGLNPFSIQLVKEWPLKSNLDPAVYGDPTSLITWEIVEREY